MKKRRLRRNMAALTLLGLIGGVALSSSALAQTATPSASASGGKVVFVEGTTNDIGTVNPFKAIETPEYEVLALNFDLLENFDKANLSAAPGIATDWQQSDDGLTWTFTIRNDATWQDGEPLTAKDIAFTYNKVLDCKLGNSLDYMVPKFTDSITAPNDTTLVWKTNVTTSAPIRPPWVYIVPEHLWGNSSCDEIKKAPFFENGKPMVGSGPFQLTAWEKGQSWTMTANPNYWNGAPHIDEFVVRKYNNAEAMITALKTGEIDYIGGASSVPVHLFNQLQTEGAASGITTHVGPAVSFGQMSFNMCDPNAADAAPYCAKTGSTGSPILRDPVVRTAMSWAIDRQTIVDKVLAGYGAPGTTIVPPFATFYHWEPTGDQLIGFDTAKANQMLDDAGYVDTNNDGIRNDPKTGDELEFRIILRSESDVSDELGKYISGWMKQIGIKLDAVSYDDGKLGDAWLANDYDLYIWGWGPDPDPDFILSTFTSAQCGSWSDTCYANPQYDQLYQDQQTAPTPEDRQKIVQQMQQMIYTDIPEVVLYYDKTLEAYDSAHWTGLEDNVSPEPVGFLWGQYTPYSALTVAPIGADQGGGDTSSGISPVVWLAILGAVVVVGAVIFLARRGRNAEDEA